MNLPKRIKDIEKLQTANGGDDIVVEGVKISAKAAILIAEICRIEKEDKRAFYESASIKDLVKRAWKGFENLTVAHAQIGLSKASGA